MKYVYTYKRGKIDERDFLFSTSILPHPEVILPKSIDLRPNCPPVYDQEDLGSCTANAGCACRVMLLNNSQTELSRLFLYYIERSLEGDVNSDAGASLRDTCKAIYNVGICEEEFMPYDVEYFKHHPSKKALTNASNYKINAYKSLSNLNEIKQNLAFRQQPVLIGMDVYESFESEHVAKTGKMTIPQKNEKLLGGHAVLVVGYIDNSTSHSSHNKNPEKSGYFIVRNSWGSNWGDKGYFYMPYAYVNDGYTYDYWIIE